MNLREFPTERIMNGEPARSGSLASAAAIAACCLLSLATAADTAAQQASAGATPDKYRLEHLDVEARDLAATPGAEASVRVLASEDRWQSSGVLLRKGSRYRASASGQWRQGVLCNPSGPSGTDSSCFPFPLVLVRGIPVGTLIGKVGKDGAAFPIGEQYEFVAQSDGILYLRHNEGAGLSFDNSGFVDVKVAVAGAPAPALADARPGAPQQLPSPAPAAGAARPSAVQHWAVVIGISQYADTQIPSLRYANADARAMYDWLVSPSGGQYAPARVKLLLDREATGTSIRDALFEWLRQAIEEDVVVIFFAGHGSPDSPDTPDNLYLLPHDARYQSIASTGFPMWDIETAMKRFIKAKRVVVIADACHSGGVGEGFDIARRATGMAPANRISTGLQSLAAIGPGVVVLSASDERQFSAESPDFGGGHGVFTHFLLEGLKGQADYNQDQRVTLGELIPYLSENVRRATRNAQTPTVAGRFDPALSIGR
jgi:uncharacterized caspase-like protein